MENMFVRHRNVTVLVALLFGQILGLAMQVKRNEGGEGLGKTPLLRVWVMNAITPIEKIVVRGGEGARDTWDDYLNLRGVRKENEQLKAQLDQMRLDQVRLEEDATQARRLQALFKFKEQYLAQTVAAQVVGSSGTEASRVIYIDKGESDGIRQDMPVITPEGVVGKVVRVMPSTAQVLLITDASWGVGGILEKSRLQGIARGTSTGDVKLTNILADEKVEPGERVLTSGGDRIFPKGLPLGTVSELLSREDLFLNIRLRPSANLSRLEEVLVITKIDDKAPQLSADDTSNGPVRASDILSQRLPNVPKNQQPVVTKPANPEEQDNEPDAQEPAGTTKPTESAVKPANGEAKPAGTSHTGTAGAATTPAGANHTGTGSAAPAGANHTGTTAAPNGANHNGANHAGATPSGAAPTNTKPQGTKPATTEPATNPQEQQQPKPKPAEPPPAEPPTGDNPR
jgi:rod shape-determining protein MreC